MALRLSSSAAAALLALCCALCGDVPTGQVLFARAEEEAVAVEGSEGGADSTLGVDSLKELSGKIQQLKSLMDAKGVPDQGLKEKLDGLEGMLAQLGQTGEKLKELTDQDKKDTDLSTAELHSFLKCCLTMTYRRAPNVGAQNALNQLAKKAIRQADAAKVDFLRMVGVCVNDLTDAEHGQCKRGALTQLPKRMVDAAKLSDAEKQLAEMDPNIWAQLSVVAAPVVKELGIEKKDTPPPVSTTYSFLAMIPLFAMFAFLGKKFYAMQNNNQMTKKEKKEAKKAGKEK